MKNGFTFHIKDLIRHFGMTNQVFDFERKISNSSLNRHDKMTIQHDDSKKKIGDSSGFWVGDTGLKIKALNQCHPPQILTNRQIYYLYQRVESSFHYDDSMTNYFLYIYFLYIYQILSLFLKNIDSSLALPNYQNCKFFL